MKLFFQIKKKIKRKKKEKKKERYITHTDVN